MKKPKLPPPPPPRKISDSKPTSDLFDGFMVGVMVGVMCTLILMAIVADLNR